MFTIYVRVCKEELRGNTTTIARSANKIQLPKLHIWH